MSSPLTQRGSIDVESEMLPQDPPPAVIRFMGWLFIALFLFGLFIAIILRLPETVHCPFVLVPATGADPIQSPHQGTINRVSVNEGQTVSRGAELFVLRSDEIRGWDTQFRTMSEDLRSKEEGLAQSDSAYLSQTSIKKAEIEQAQSEVTFRDNHAKTSRDLYDRMEKLAKKGGFSEVDLVRMKLELAGSEKDSSVAQRSLQQVTLDGQRLQTEHARTRGEQQNEIEKLKMRIAALKTDLENAQDNMLTVRSPYDGVVISVEQRSVGSVVTQGQMLCQLSQMNAQPRARMIVSETGLAKLAVSQRVRYFFEAYPYQRYGAVDGKLDWISPSTVTSTDGPHFIAIASLERSSISGHGSRDLPLRVGMKGDAHIIVGGRTLIEYAFEPIRQLRESVRQ
jgi:hemolysin D